MMRDVAARLRSVRPCAVTDRGAALDEAVVPVAERPQIERIVALGDITGAVAGAVLDATWPDPAVSVLDAVLAVTAAAASRRWGARVSHVPAAGLDEVGATGPPPDICVPVVVSDDRQTAGHLHLTFAGDGAPTVADRLVLEFLAGHAVDLATVHARAGSSAGVVVQLRAELADARADVEQLTLALESNRRIGMAMGILAASAKLTPEQAFERLRNASQSSNRKLRDVADDLVLTGDVSSLTDDPSPRTMLWAPDAPTGATSVPSAPGVVLTEARDAAETAVLRAATTSEAPRGDPSDPPRRP